MKDPPGQGEPFEGGSATSRKLSRSADSSAPKRGTAGNSIGLKARGCDASGDSADISDI
jgi:hypothetical protein